MVLAGFSAAIDGILVATQGPIHARPSEALNRDPLVAAFLAFLSATLVTGLLILHMGEWRSLSFAGPAKLLSWVWLGGLVGAHHVVIPMRAIPGSAS